VIDRRPNGRTNLIVPVIGMGTWRTFDTNEDRRPLVEEALAAGMNLFDTSPMYGLGETALAHALAARRDQAIVATKIWTPSADVGRRQAEHALRLFGWVDVYQVHNLVNVPVQLRLIETLRDEGTVRAVGATHYQVEAFPEMAALMKTGRLDMVQIPYNPLRREAEKDLLPIAHSLGIGVFVMSPLRGGILDAQPSPAQLAELGVETWAQAVLKWIASDERVSTVLTATSRPGRPTESAAAGNRPFFTHEQRDLIVAIAERR
jgi:aryl-alcohol dehydrogenase-like predicted oxidoreductase